MEELRGQMALSLEGPVVSKTPGIHKWENADKTPGGMQTHLSNSQSQKKLLLQFICPKWIRY